MRKKIQLLPLMAISMSLSIVGCKKSNVTPRQAIQAEKPAQTASAQTGDEPLELSDTALSMLLNATISAQEAALAQLDLEKVITNYHKLTKKQATEQTTEIVRAYLNYRDKKAISNNLAAISLEAAASLNTTTKDQKLISKKDELSNAYKALHTATLNLQAHTTPFLLAKTIVASYENPNSCFNKLQKLQKTKKRNIQKQAHYEYLQNATAVNLLEKELTNIIALGINEYDLKSL